MTGREAYEADCRRKPSYPNGAPRLAWDQLDSVAQWSWNKNPTPRPWNKPSELTPAGEQYVIPGCERNASPKAKQLGLFG